MHSYLCESYSLLNFSNRLLPKNSANRSFVSLIPFKIAFLVYLATI